MDPRHIYGREKLSVAVNTMAVMDEPLAARLEFALQELVLLSAANLPAESWDAVQAIKAEGTRVAATGNEGTIAATIRAMKAEERHDLAQKIVDCFMALVDTK